MSETMYFLYNSLPISTQLQCGVVTEIALGELSSDDRARVLHKISGWDYSPLTRIYFSPEAHCRVRKARDRATSRLKRKHERSRANLPSRSKKR
jgi:hypothetical protein